ncbi:TlpA family protein disulfide reductase [Paenibacillus sp. YYML68]|uniref:TlpA family protein disulfide reductase n=1 Tax=Paenibacillus sp. YYML68 TaxID=2909250 RepID=UPI00248FB5F8|nr:TlpA family protein disulfide reductase [Paenibacillus sp. YYML68]
MRNRMKVAVGAVVVLFIGGVLQWQHVKERSSEEAASVWQPAALQQSAVAHQSGGQKLTKGAPVYELEGLDGRSYTIGGKRDKPLIVNFWASWCGPCHEEAPDLSYIYEKYGDKLDLYAVNTTKADQMNSVYSFVSKHKVKFPVLLDRSGTAADGYRLVFVPTSFLIDKEGRLLETIHVLPRAELESKVQRLLSEG